MNYDKNICKIKKFLNLFTLPVFLSQNKKGNVNTKNTGKKKRFLKFILYYVLFINDHVYYF